MAWFLNRANLFFPYQIVVIDTWIKFASFLRIDLFHELRITFSCIHWRFVFSGKPNLVLIHSKSFNYYSQSSLIFNHWYWHIFLINRKSSELNFVSTTAISSGERNSLLNSVLKIRNVLAGHFVFIKSKMVFGHLTFLK